MHKDKPDLNLCCGRCWMRKGTVCTLNYIKPARRLTSPSYTHAYFNQYVHALQNSPSSPSSAAEFLLHHPRTPSHSLAHPSHPNSHNYSSPSTLLSHSHSHQAPSPCSQTPYPHHHTNSAYWDYAPQSQCPVHSPPQQHSQAYSHMKNLPLYALWVWG